MKNKRLILILSMVPLLLLIPLLAMCFTQEVVWDLPDFIGMFVLLMSSGLAIEFTLRKVKKTKNRLILCFGILLVLLLIWAELAVGLFGTPFAGS